MSEYFDVSEYTPAQVLAAAYNASKPQGLGFMHFSPEPWTTEDAEDYLINANMSDDWEKGLKNQHHFDYIKGRAVKLNLYLDSDNEVKFPLNWYDHSEESVMKVMQELENSK